MEVPEDKAPKPSEPSEGPSGGESTADDDDYIPAIPEPPKASASVFVVTKIVIALVIAGSAAGGVSFLSGSFGGYGVFSSVLGNQGIPQKVFGIIFLVTILIVLPNMVGWNEMMKAFSVTPSRPRRRVQPRPETPATYAAPKPGGKTKAEGPAPAGGDEPKQTPEPEPEEPPPSKEVVEAEKSVMTFMGRSMEFISANNEELIKGGKLSAFNQFGTDLFLAGAAEAYSDTHGIKDEMGKVIEACVQAMGRSSDRAGQFSVKYDSTCSSPGTWTCSAQAAMP